MIEKSANTTTPARTFEVPFSLQLGPRVAALPQTVTC